ncbi:WXG100 family type VII secretion target [Streptomyces sp. NPDC048581]|uniref:WXG100 family type VII secretion target n=1 Tax=unclassified Streptomyces TaxID=2593676 RepID=UPI0037249431
MGGKDTDSFGYVDPQQCFAEKHSTPFGVDFDMDQMKAMVQDADPVAVKRVAEAWEALNKDLVGGGGIKESLDTAVQHVLAHWEGESADLFRQRAQFISQQVTDSAKYATNTAQSLKGAAAVLEDVKPTIMAMEKPSKLASGADFVGNLGDRDGGPAADNAIRGGASSQQALDDNAGSLSEGKERQLKMAAQMEILGAAYNSRAAEMGSWVPKPKPPNGHRNDEDGYPGDPGGIPPAAVVVPTGSAPRSPQGATSGTARGGQVGTISPSKPVAPPSGITGGAHKPAAPQPQVGTAIDGVSGGRTVAPTGGGVAPVAGGSASSGGTVNGGAGLGGGVAGGAAGAGAARGGMAGRAGAAGMAGRAAGGGLGGAAGAGAGKGGAAARTGGMARQSGGVVGGTPKGGAGAGRGTAGGSGLLRSRGAAGAGAGAVRRGGMVGAPGARTGRPNDEEQREGERPDYLVEDEETWAPQTNAAPRVIE